MSLFFKKAALGLDHLLEPGPERLARPHDVVLGQGPPRVQVRAGGGPHRLGPESGQGRRQPLLGPFGRVGRSSVLLEDVVAIRIGPA